MICQQKQTFHAQLFHNYTRKKKKRANFVKEKHLNAMALTSDIWTSRNNDAFIDITGHCMETNFTLKAVLLDTLHFPEHHTGEEILKKLDYVLGSYRMDVERTKLFIVTDNASNYGLALRKVNQIITAIPCFAHTLQLVINDLIKTDEGLGENLKIGNDIVAFYRRSHVGLRNLNKNQRELGLLEEKLHPAVATRWESEYLKEKKLIGNKRPLALSLGETKYASRIRSTNQWTHVEEFVAVMEPFFQATEKMSGERYPTLSCAIPVIYSLQESVRKTLEQTQSQSVRCLTGALLSGLKKLQTSGCTVLENCRR